MPRDQTKRRQAGRRPIAPAVARRRTSTEELDVDIDVEEEVESVMVVIAAAAARGRRDSGATAVPIAKRRRLQATRLWRCARPRPKRGLERNTDVRESLLRSQFPKGVGRSLGHRAMDVDLGDNLRAPVTPHDPDNRHELFSILGCALHQKGGRRGSASTPGNASMTL